ncbi:MAG TPA: glycosyltransferase family 4 protein [Candidatus Paceibacterota bacterium]|nr:glycosyltransferase family 4 protein [Candidatus Paceibacterota bacterium]
MRVVMFSSDRSVFAPGSPVRDRLLAQAACMDELHVIVFAARSGKFLAERLAPHVWIHPTASFGKAFLLPDAIRLAQVLTTSHAGEWLATAQDPFACGIAAFFFARGKGIPLHLQLHTDPWAIGWRKAHPMNAVRLAVASALLLRADGVRVVSERARRGVLALGVPREKVTKVPIPVDISAYTNREPGFDLRRSYPYADQIVLSLGRLEKEKNMRLLLRAFVRVRSSHSSAELLIVGSGSEHDALVSVATRMGIAGAVHFIPWARDTLSYYKGADVYVQSSDYEGWGLAVIEAAASGTPVVMTDVGCAGEVIRDGETGLVVPIGDEEQLAEAIVRVLDDKELASRISRNAQAAVEAFATPAEAMKLYEASYIRAYTARHDKAKKR